MRKGLIVLLLVCSSVWVNGANRTDYSSKTQEGKARLEAFRSFRYPGDFSFQIDLVHYPRRGQPTRYMGTLWGSWNAKGPVTRVSVETPKGPLDLLIQNGPESGVWKHEVGKGVRELSQEELMEPLWEGVSYTPFDLQMGFLFWDDYTYNGVAEVMGREAFMFYFYPPRWLQQMDKEFGGMNVAMDDKYNAVLRADYLDPVSQIKRSMRILNFKKVQGQYVVKQIDLVDNVKREKTRLEVKSAAMNIDVPVTYLRPETMGEGLPSVKASAYSRL